MPQRQHYLPGTQKRPRASLPVPVNHDYVFAGASATQSAAYDTCLAGNLPNYILPRQPTNNYQSVPRQLYQLGQSLRVYQHMEEKGVYQVNGKDCENRSEGFYTTFDPEGKEVDYSDKYFEEVIANLVRIETVCSKYSS